MPIDRINVGTLANDGTGDDLRQAFVKVNNNFDDINSRVQGQATAQNLGAGTGIFYSKENGVIGLKSLVAGANIEITSDNDTVTISTPGTINLQATSGTGAITGANRTLVVQGGTNISTTALGNTITVNVDSTGLVQSDSSPALGGNLDANSNSITNANSITAQAINGALTGTVDGINVTDMYNTMRNVRGFDFGDVTNNYTSGLDFVIANTTVDYGSIITPGSTISDFGSIV
tara:strand:+ start:2315 stop:3013 length:699 start_codon:yes stop_codon:yes gene_type:complete